MGQFKMKRVYEAADGSDGDRVLVDRIWPRGMTKERVGADVWLKEIGPTFDLIRWFGHRPERYEEFRTHYVAELKSEALQPFVDRLLERVQTQDVTLLYSAKDEQHNQAAVLMEYLKERQGGSLQRS